MIDRDKIAKRLSARLAELTGRVQEIEGELRQPLDPNLEDQATQLEDLDALGGIEKVAFDEIEEIKRTLARIENGTYGICAKCGGEIEAERLAMRPMATECIACAKQ